MEHQVRGLATAADTKARLMHRRILLAAIAVTVGLVSDASAAASKCERSSTKKASVVLDRTTSAVVFRRPGLSKVWACRRKSSRIWRLPVARYGYAFGKGKTPQIAGRFVGYVDKVVPDAGLPEEDTVRVLDLKTGKLRVSTPAHSLEFVGAKLVWSFVLNDNGATAWIATGAEGFRAEGLETVEVHRVTSTDPARNEVLDSAPHPTSTLTSPIPYRSLALSADAATIYWLHDGQARSAALP